MLVGIAVLAKGRHRPPFPRADILSRNTNAQLKNLGGVSLLFFVFLNAV